MNHLMGRILIELVRVCTYKTCRMPREFDDSDLHPKADAEIRDVMLPGIPGCQNHSLDAPPAEAAGDDDPLRPAEDLPDVFFVNSL